MFERNIKMLRGEAADWLGTPGPKVQDRGDFLGLLCPIDTLAAREANDPETPMGTNKTAKEDERGSGNIPLPDSSQT